MNYWLVVGAVQNWDTAFEHGNIWGLRKTQQHLWDSLCEGDTVIFYATQPVGGVIGYGVVRTKFRQNRPLWPEELQTNTLIWPLRFEFDTESCLPRGDWKFNKVISKEIWPRAGFQLINQSTAEKIITAISPGGYNIPEKEKTLVAEEKSKYGTNLVGVERPLTSHDGVQEKLIEIGRLQNYIVEKEYPFDIGKLDVVWRRVVNSVPTYVFEVQIGGDIYHALSKLKHAYDLWNSHIFIIASERDLEKTNVLLSGTFHEIGKRIKFVELDRVEELYNRKKAYFDLEKELGIE